MTIADIKLSGPFMVYAVNLGQYIFDNLDPSAPGDIPPDVACLPVVGIRSVRSDTRSVTYIDTVL